MGEAWHSLRQFRPVIMKEDDMNFFRAPMVIIGFLEGPCYWLQHIGDMDEVYSISCDT